MRVYNDFDLTDFNSYKIKAKCQMALFPDTENDVIHIFKNYKNLILLGSGHNIILAKSYYSDNFIIFNGNYSNYEVDAQLGTICAESGISMLEISELALQHSLSGVEIFYDIPSSLGGAVVMNAGAGGEEIKDVLLKVRYLDLEDMEVKEIKKEDIGFEYRNSFFQRNSNKVILKVWLQLKKSDPDQIKDKMETNKSVRWSKQPKEFPNAGSVFKRPPGYYVGALIDDLKLKGYTVGGAKISEKHGGFIINFNNASGEDILQIVNEVKRRVYEKYNVELEVEQRVI